ncbi:hypothetical protein [Nocardia sp. NPDC050717]|uniref:helix-turn-helix domain-containing protein n=1 Tax=Nocardia sp. NPDC050717 TaxID=3157221 RepID=UPI0033EC33D2
MSDERSIDDAVSTPNTEITALAQQVATARGKLPLQHDTALYDALSDSEIRAERELAEWIRAQRRKQRRRAVADELAAEQRDRRTGALIRRTDEADARWHRKALAARRRVSSADARLAQLYRRAEWSSRALIGVVVLGMVWAGVNVQHNLVPSGDMSDPLYWLSFGIEAMISIPIITIMVAATTAARWGRELERGKVLVFELALLGTTVALNAGPHLAAGAWGRAAEYSIAPVMVGVVIWLHAWVSARYALLIESASVELPGEVGTSFARSEQVSDAGTVREPGSVRDHRLSAMTASPSYAPTEQVAAEPATAAASAAHQISGVNAHHRDVPTSEAVGTPLASTGVRAPQPERVAAGSPAHTDESARNGFSHLAASTAAEVNSPAAEPRPRTEHAGGTAVVQVDTAIPKGAPGAYESPTDLADVATGSAPAVIGGVDPTMAGTVGAHETISAAATGPTPAATSHTNGTAAGTTDAVTTGTNGIAADTADAATTGANGVAASAGMDATAALSEVDASAGVPDVLGMDSTNDGSRTVADSAVRDTVRANAEAGSDHVAAETVSSTDLPADEVVVAAKVERKLAVGRRASVDKAAVPGTLELIHKAAAEHRRNGDYARANGAAPTVRRIPVTAGAQATADAASGTDPVPEATAHAGSVARDRNGDTAASPVVHNDPQPEADEPEQLTLTAELDVEPAPARERELSDSTPASVDEPARRDTDPASVAGNEPAGSGQDSQPATTLAPESPLTNNEPDSGSHQRPETESAPSEPITQAQPMTAEQPLAKPAPKKPLRKIESSDLVEDEPVEPEDLDDYDFDDDNEVRALARQIAHRSPLRLTLDQIEEILELTDQSWSARSIGAEVGVSGTTVTNIVEFARKIRHPYAFTG